MISVVSESELQAELSAVMLWIVFVRFGVGSGGSFEGSWPIKLN